MRVSKLALQGLYWLAVLTLAACGGGGSSHSSSSSSSPVTVSGYIYYERPWDQTVTSDGSVSLTVNSSASAAQAARGITVEILNSRTNEPYSSISSVKTDANGYYSVEVPSGTTFRLGILSELISTDSSAAYSFTVRDNMQCDSSGDCPVYEYYDSTQTATASGSSMSLNLTAPSNCTNLTTSAASCSTSRPSAPFAILDTAYRFAQLLATGQAARGLSLNLTALNFYWSSSNYAELPSSGDCINRVDPSTGAIGTTHFRSTTLAASATCPIVPWGVYVLGDAVLSATESGADFDEYDAPVIAHELGHFYELAFARSDSLGGPHDFGSYLDMTVSWSEGFADAFSSMVRDSPGYSDALFYQGYTGLVYFSFNVEQDSYTSDVASEGWYSERSVQELVWDVYDSSVASGETDNLSLGFGPINQAIAENFANATSLTSIYLFADALENVSSAAASQFPAMLQAHNIYGTDEFGIGETNTASASTSVLPQYTTLTLDTPTVVTSSNPYPNDDAYYASYNRIGSHRYLTFTAATAGTYQLSVTSPTSPSSDPDVIVWYQGDLIDYGLSATNGSETISDMTLPYAGTYVIEVEECSNLGQLCSGDSTAARGDTALTVTITQ